MLLSIVKYYPTAIPSGIAKIRSLHEESFFNKQTTDTKKTGIRADNLGTTSNSYIRSQKRPHSFQSEDDWQPLIGTFRAYLLVV